MNLAVHGLEGDIKHGGQVNSYYDDPHEATGRFDFVLANPPFNVNAVDKELLKESMPRFRALSLGATMHHIKRAALDQIVTLLPPWALRTHFDALVEPMHQQLIALTKQVRTLRRTRDLLLPRLLFGLVKLGVEAA